MVSEDELFADHGITEPDEAIKRLVEALLPVVPGSYRRELGELAPAPAMEYCPVKSGCWTKTPGGRICFFHRRSS